MAKKSGLDGKSTLRQFISRLEYSAIYYSRFLLPVSIANILTLRVVSPKSADYQGGTSVVIDET